MLYFLVIWLQRVAPESRILRWYVRWYFKFNRFVMMRFPAHYVGYPGFVVFFIIPDLIFAALAVFAAKLFTSFLWLDVVGYLSSALTVLLLFMIRLYADAYYEYLERQSKFGRGSYLDFSSDAVQAGPSFSFLLAVAFVLSSPLLIDKLISARLPDSLIQWQYILWLFLLVVIYNAIALRVAMCGNNGRGLLGIPSLAALFYSVYISLAVYAFSMKNVYWPGDVGTIVAITASVAPVLLLFAFWGRRIRRQVLAKRTNMSQQFTWTRVLFAVPLVGALAGIIALDASGISLTACVVAKTPDAGSYLGTLLCWLNEPRYLLIMAAAWLQTYFAVPVLFWAGQLISSYPVDPNT